MTDRHAGYIVTLDRDIREDDAEEIVNALGMVRGVVSVEPVTANHDLHIAQARRDNQWREALYGFARSGPGELPPFSPA
jgi:hypothetical protein